MSHTKEQRSAIVERCSHIFENVVQRFDSQIYHYLQNHEIEPQLFLLRWIRLLFTREFHIDDTIKLWDYLIADGVLYGINNSNSEAMGILKSCTHTDSKKAAHISSQALPLVDYICCAMLSFDRCNLLQMESHQCLKRLLKYPPVESVESLISLARKLRSKGSKCEAV